ncbi:MAG: phosphoribosyltransferase domain-containing protein [Lachnospiraceae bacterium]|nr:phosphoribosyltransferase domain-containing protein [Lachnospiraceae bacterium]
MKKYDENQLVRLAKRDNNTKRAYLLVNPLQGKHIPVSTKNALGVFKDLAQRLYSKYPNENLMLIGFAETATAICAAVAAFAPTEIYFLQTTREFFEDTEFLYFSETHSHAVEQKLVKTNFEKYLNSSDRIIFVEDEVTTGNTIQNAIQAIKAEYKNKPLKFGIASILNSVSDERINEFKARDIDFTYLLHLTATDYTQQLENFSFSQNSQHSFEKASNSAITELEITNKPDPRIGTSNTDFMKKCNLLATRILDDLGLGLENKSILVLGSEEFMFPALFTAKKIEENCNCTEVNFHATTRSPILPSESDNYPLFSRYQLKSLYDNDRTIFVYNLKRYDKVIVIHDSPTTNPLGIHSLVAALDTNQCNDITIYKWSD